MTKKSAAREERDAAKQQAQATPTLWANLNNLHGALQNGLENAVRKVQILYRSEGLVPALRKGDPREISVAMRGLANDYTALMASLNAIYIKHKDFDVSQETPEDAILALEIGGEYEDWQANFLAAVMPNVEYLIAEIDLVLQGIRRQVAANSLEIVKNELSESTPA